MGNIYKDYFKYFFDGDLFNVALIGLSIGLIISMSMLLPYFHYIKLIGE